jgi:hypothetical protein
MELEAIMDAGSEPVTIVLNSNSGSPSADISFQNQPSPDGSTAVMGSTKVEEFPGTGLTNVAVVTSVVPQRLTLTVNTIWSYIMVIHTSLDTPKDLLATTSRDWISATADSRTLWSSHQDAWKIIWSSGYEITGRIDVARAVNASIYAIMASVRPDWPYSLAPGGLTQAYNGHSFWDCETW